MIKNHCIVLFGGAHGWSRRLNDTWTFDGTTWRELKSASQPAPRTRPAMVFDAARRQVLMFGGQGGSGALDDTWVLLRDGWVLRMPANRPPAGSHAIAFDAVRQRVVIRVATGGTWEWDGFDWTQRAPATAPPSTVFDTIASWDPLRARVVLYTPESGTWLYGAEPPAAVETFGHSCGGAGGIPTLASQSGYGPTLGERFTLMASSLPTHPLAVLELGASRTWWGGQALPLDLGLLGMTGCALFVSLDLEARATVANGAAVWPLRIPDMPAVLGATLYGQVVAHDPTANTPGLVWSDALSATVGGR